MSARVIDERVRARTSGRTGRVRATVGWNGVGERYDVEHDDDGSCWWYGSDDLVDLDAARDLAGEEVRLLKKLLAEALRRTVGLHGAMVVVPADLDRARPGLVVDQREDGAWRMCFDVRQEKKRDVT